MRRLAAQLFRGAAGLLALGAVVVFLAACGGSAPPATEMKDEPAPAQPAASSGGPSPEASGAAPGQPPHSTAEAVPVASVEASVPNGRDTYPAASPVAATPSGALAASADITAEQIAAALEDVLHGVYQSSLPSIVYLRVPTPASEALRGFQGIPDDVLWGQGSGFVWDDQGHIVTNHHVVDGAEEVVVFFADSTQATGTVVGSDPHSDLAVVKLEEGDWTAQPVKLGDSDEVRVGQLAVAIGSPFGQDFTMTSGIVSALGRNIRGESGFSVPEVIQTDSALNPGNSGGPLLDRQGRVIGVNTQIISRTGNFSGVGMAVPVNIVRRVVPPLIADGEFNYSWLGVQITTVNAAYAEELDLPEISEGALIIAVVEDGPADKAKLLGSESSVIVGSIERPSGGDTIIAVGSHPISGANELIAHLTYNTQPGDTVTLTVLREDGERKEMEVTLGQRPER